MLMKKTVKHVSLLMCLILMKMLITSNRGDWYCKYCHYVFLYKKKSCFVCVQSVVTNNSSIYFFFVCFFNKLLYILNVSTFLFQSSDWHVLAFFTHKWKEVCLLQIKKMDKIHFTTDNTDKKYCLQTNICTTNAR